MNYLKITSKYCWPELSSGVLSISYILGLLFEQLIIDQIIKLTVTVQRIFALFEEFNVGFSTFFDSLSNQFRFLSNWEVRNVPPKKPILKKTVHFNNFWGNRNLKRLELL
jgi:hypothetical protein